MEWIKANRRLPKTTDEVLITWINSEPAPYYSDIKDKPFVSTGHFYKGKWFWHGNSTKEYLDEYGICGYTRTDMVDHRIHITAWAPMPEPYKEEK